MTGFIVGASLLLLATVGLLAWPLLRRATPASVSTRQLTATVYRDKLAELDQDLAAGSLAQADYDLSRAELQRRLLEDSSAVAEAPAAAAPPKGKALLLGLVTLLPVAAVGLYLAIGEPAALASHPQAQRLSKADIEQMVAGLAAKLEKEPDNHRGWAMLGRSYKMMGRFADAVRAYEHTGPLLDSSADLLVDYADAVAAAAQGFDDKARRLIDRALTLDPNHPQGLWMRGSAAFDAKQFDRAIADWQKLLALLPADSDDAKTVQGNLAQARERLGSPPGAASVEPGASRAPAAAGARIQGQVELAPALAQRVAAGDVLMVIARPTDGSRMPVAVLKVAAAGFPAAFTLDDSLAMAAERSLSAFAEVRIEARVSHQGQAKAAPGDLIGEGRAAVKVGARDVRVTIDRVVN